MMKRFSNWLESKFKQHYVFLHIPTGLYLAQKVSITFPATSVDFELMETPTVFYSYFGKTKNLEKLLGRILKAHLHLQAGNFSFLHPNVDRTEFELVRYYGKI